MGVDDVDVAAATELGILVCHAPTEANCFAVAETTVAMMLALLKRLRERDAAVRAARWREPGHAGVYLGRRADGYSGITVGIVGLGRIGTRVAQLLAPWRLAVVGCDPYVEPSRFHLAGVERLDLAGLLAVADVVSVHVTLTAETRGMIGEQAIAAMRPGAFVINTARGGILDEAAVARALMSGRLGGAAIDAFVDEPPGTDSPLLGCGRRVLLSPHAAAQSVGGELKPGIAWAMRSVLSALAGEVPDNVYNSEVIPLWRARFGRRLRLTAIVWKHTVLQELAP